MIPVLSLPPSSHISSIAYTTRADSSYALPTLTKCSRLRAYARYSTTNSSVNNMIRPNTHLRKRSANDPQILDHRGRGSSALPPNVAVALSRLTPPSKAEPPALLPAASPIPPSSSPSSTPPSSTTIATATIGAAAVSLQLQAGAALP